MRCSVNDMLDTYFTLVPITVIEDPGVLSLEPLLSPLFSYTLDSVDLYIEFQMFRITHKEQS